MEAAAEIIANTKDISKVINQIEIAPVFVRTDTDMQVLLESKIHELKHLETETIYVQVEKGSSFTHINSYKLIKYKFWLSCLL